MNPIVKNVLAQLQTEGNSSIKLPPGFNFAFDVIDYQADHDDKLAYIAVNADGSEIIEHRFSDLKQRSARVASALRNQGIDKGEFAIVILPRIPQWYEVIIGCIKAGVVSMPGTNLLTAKDIEYRVKKADASTVIVSAEHIEKIDAIRANCPTLEHFIVAVSYTHLTLPTIYSV